MGSVNSPARTDSENSPLCQCSVTMAAHARRKRQSTGRGRPIGPAPVFQKDGAGFALGGGNCLGIVGFALADGGDFLS